jgi:tetratricopeptide (TPR) repeat protein
MDEMVRILLLGLIAVLALPSAFACETEKDARTQALEAQNEAHAFAREGRLDEAIARYTEAIAIDPSIALIYHGRGVVYREVGDHPAALADFTKALELDPDRAVTYLERGRTYFALEDFTAAEADIQRALDLSNNDPDIFYPAQTLLDSIRSGDAALDAAQ